MISLSEKDPEKIREGWRTLDTQKIKEFAPLILNSKDQEPTAKQLHALYCIHGIDPNSSDAYRQWQKIRKAHEDGAAEVFKS